VADTENDLIRKITPAGTVTTTAGVAGAIGSADGTGASARFYRPTSLVMDAAGNLYVADTSNNLIRKITPAGDVVTIVGQAASKEYLFGPLPGSLLAPRSVALFDDTLYVTTGNAVVRVSNVP
jgi:hypothetical protein